MPNKSIISDIQQKSDGTELMFEPTADVVEAAEAAVAYKKAHPGDSIRMAFNGTSVLVGRKDDADAVLRSWEEIRALDQKEKQDRTI